MKKILKINILLVFILLFFGLISKVYAIDFVGSGSAYNYKRLSRICTQHTNCIVYTWDRYDTKPGGERHILQNNFRKTAAEDPSIRADTRYGAYGTGMYRTSNRR